jgi:hypothetical protein
LNASGSAGSHGIQDARVIIEDNSAKHEITESTEGIIMDILANGQDAHDEVHKIETFSPTLFPSTLQSQQEVQVHHELIADTSQQSDLYEKLGVGINKNSEKEPTPYVTVLPSQSEELDQFIEELTGRRIEPVISRSEAICGSSLAVLKIVEVGEKKETRNTLRASLNSDVSNDDFLGISHGFNDGSSLDLGSRPPEEIYLRGSSHSRHDKPIIDEEPSDHSRHLADVEVSWVFKPQK